MWKPQAGVALTARVALAIIITVVPSVASDEDPLLQKSRALTNAFASRLQHTLQNAVTAGGPTVAIGVCKDLAPQIASELSRQSGAKISRTSVRIRNPINAPEPWQTAVLEGFAGQLDSKEPLEYFARGEAEAPTRYVRAIRIAEVCLACHGSELSAAVRDQLERDYPFDQAYGYQLGELRGAFSISWPTEGETK